MLDLGFTTWFSDTITLEDAFGILSAANCHSVEVAGNTNHLTEAASIRSSLGRYGLDVTAVSAGVPFFGNRSLNLHAGDESMRRRSVEYIRNCVDFASQLGAGLVYVCSITKDTRPHEESLELLGVSLKSCADYAERAGVVIALEPFPTGELPSAREAGDLIEKVESNNLGLLLDTGHLAISGEPLKETAKEWKDILVHVHFNNNDGLGDLHWPPQRGKLTKGDFRGLLAELESGYHGKVSVELLNPEPVVGTITDSMKYIQSLSPER